MFMNEDFHDWFQIYCSILYQILDNFLYERYKISRKQNIRQMVGTWSF